MLLHFQILCRHLSLEQQTVRERDHNNTPQDASWQLPTMNSCTQKQSPELRTFREMYDTLQEVFLHSLDPDSFANKLYAKEVITKDTHTEVQSQDRKQRKCTLLLSAVHNQIKHKPSRYRTFWKLLSEDPAMEVISKKMIDTYKQQLSLDAGPTANPSYIDFTEPLKGDDFDNICNQYRKAIMSSDSPEVDRLTEGIKNAGNSELMAFFTCYQGLEIATVRYQLNKAKRIFKQSLKLAEETESWNRQLLLGRAYRMLAGVARRERNYKQGLEIIDLGKEALQLAKPSSEKACLFMEEALLRQLSEKRTSERQEEIEQLMTKALKNASCCSDHQRACYTISLVHLRQALFYLDAFEDKKRVSPDLKNLHRAEVCLRKVELKLVGGTNIYQMEYYVAYSALSLYRQNPTEALTYAEKAEGLLRKSRIADDSYLHVRARLEELKGRRVILKGLETRV